MNSTSLHPGYFLTKDIASQAETHRITCCEERSVDPKTICQMVLPFSSLESSQVLQIVKDLSEFLNDQQKSNLLDYLTTRVRLGHLESLRLASRLHSNCTRTNDCYDFVSWLPPDLVLHIFSYLPWSDLASCLRVNRNWHNVCQNPLLYRRFCLLPEWKFPVPEQPWSQQVVDENEKDEARRRGALSSVTQPMSSSWRSWVSRSVLSLEKTDWFKVFRKRVELRRNWLLGRYRIRKFTGHNEAIYCVAYDTFRIASGSSDATIRVWNVRTNAPWSVQTLRGHSGAVRCLQLLPVISVSNVSDELVARPYSPNTLESPEAILISGSADTTIKLWRLSTSKKWSRITCTNTLQGHTEAVRCLQADHQKLFSGSYDCTIRLWNLKSGQLCHTFRGHTAGVVCLTYDDMLLYSGSLDNTVRVWCLASNICLYILNRSTATSETYYWLTRVASLHLDAPRNRLLMAHHDGLVLSWSVPLPRERPSTLAASGDPVSVTLSDRFDENGVLSGTVVRCIEGDGWHIVCGTDDNTLKVWSADSDQLIAVVRGHEDGVTCAAVTMTALVSGSYDKSVLLYDFDIT